MENWKFTVMHAHFVSCLGLHGVIIQLVVYVAKIQLPVANFLSGFLIPSSADIEGQNLVLSAKRSLINSSNDIPSEILQMHPGAVVHVNLILQCFCETSPLRSNSSYISSLVGLYLQHHRSWLFCPLSWTFDWFLSQGQSKKLSTLPYFLLF